MAKKKNEIVQDEEIVENISVEPMENVMGDRYATYAKYVIQDRAIPDVRDGLKPVQRRIIFSMFRSGNLFNRPTRKCAHTVGAVMGTFHPHGDSSIYEALAHMSQDWKFRYPLIDFQGNNGSIDGDSPAAYRYTESRLSELSNELIRDIDKKTVDMQLNFDDTELEPTVLPARFPNLLCNGTEGIAVAIATEIPPHNLREVTDAIVYRIGHKTATTEDLMQFIKGPDFPGGGIIYESEGLKSIYTTGRGRIEVASKTEIVQNHDNQQIVITEIPYKIVKSQLVYEIDKIIHSKAVDGMIEVRDESDWKGIRIVIDCKKDARCDLLVQYLMNKTPLLSGYSANMVAIDGGHPKTLTLIEFIDSYIAHQVDVVTRQSRFDLAKYSDRLHIVEGLILASLNIKDVVDIIQKSKDKQDSKLNLMSRYGLSLEQAEAIVMMPLYKLSHTDEITLMKEKEELEANIERLKGILEDPNKLNRVLVHDLKAIAAKYGDDRRTLITAKEELAPIDKRDLIAKEDVMVVVTRDGYVKRSSIKSYRSSNDALPGIKEGDRFVSIAQMNTTDYLVCFTNIGNYICIPVHKIVENKWKDEGIHLNSFVTLYPNEKIYKCMNIADFRDDLYLGILTRFGQIKRMSVASLDKNKHGRPVKFMNCLHGDEITGIELLTGNSDLLVITSNGTASLFNENDLNVLGSKAGGVKSISGLGKATASALLAFDEEERSKFILITDKGHRRVLDNTKVMHTARLGKVTEICPCFKNDVHHVVAAVKVNKKDDVMKLLLALDNGESLPLEITDFYMDEVAKNAKTNIDGMPKKALITDVFREGMERIDSKNVSHPILVKEKKEKDETAPLEGAEGGEETPEADSEAASITPTEATPEAKPKQEEKEGFEQISIFDDLDE